MHNVKGRMTIRRETSSSLPGGNPLNPTPSRPNRRTRLWEFESKPGTTIARLEKAYLDAFDVVDKLDAHRDEATKSGKFTEDGLRDTVLQAALQSTSTLKAGRNAIAKARAVGPIHRMVADSRQVLYSEMACILGWDANAIH
jgi:hypothetical protein